MRPLDRLHLDRDVAAAGSDGQDVPNGHVAGERRRQQSAATAPQSQRGQPEQLEAPDPASAPFAGPFGVPRTYQERASLLRQHYRAAREETGYLDVPEDVL